MKNGSAHYKHMNKFLYRNIMYDEQLLYIGAGSFVCLGQLPKHELGSWNPVSATISMGKT